MNVYTSSELASKTKAVCDAVRKQGCAFITNNGKVDVMMVDLSNFDTLNDAVRSYDEWMGLRTLESVWARTADTPLSEGDVEAEIAAVRASRTSRDAR